MNILSDLIEIETSMMNIASDLKVVQMSDTDLLETYSGNGKETLYSILIEFVPKNKHTPAFLTDVKRLIDSKYPTWFSGYGDTAHLQSRAEKDLHHLNKHRVDLDIANSIRSIIIKHYSSEDKTGRLKDIDTSIKTTELHMNKLEQVVRGMQLAEAQNK